MRKPWKFEQDCRNSIAIYRRGEKVAEILSDEDESSDEDFETARFIIDACNTKEAGK